MLEPNSRYYHGTFVYKHNSGKSGQFVNKYHRQTLFYASIKFYVTLVKLATRQHVIVLHHPKKQTQHTRFTSKTCRKFKKKQQDYLFQMPCCRENKGNQRFVLECLVKRAALIKTRGWNSFIRVAA